MKLRTRSTNRLNNVITVFLSISAHDSKKPSQFTKTVRAILYFIYWDVYHLLYCAIVFHLGYMYD